MADGALDLSKPSGSDSKTASPAPSLSRSQRFPDPLRQRGLSRSLPTDTTLMVPRQPEHKRLRDHSLPEALCPQWSLHHHRVTAQERM